MMGNNIHFKGVIWKIIPTLSLLPLLILSTVFQFLEFSLYCPNTYRGPSLRQLIQCVLVDSSTVICGTSPFVILGLGSILLLSFYF